MNADQSRASQIKWVVAAAAGLIVSNNSVTVHARVFESPARSEANCNKATDTPITPNPVPPRILRCLRTSRLKRELPGPAVRAGVLTFC